MAQTIRVSLPGYNALTDNNPDHFALYADQDWVLIKEKVRGSFLGNATPNPYVINHNLGYIPFFLVFAYDGTGYTSLVNTWQLVGNGNLEIWVASVCNVTNLTIYQDNDPNTKFIYYIFYDNIVGSSNQSITQSDKVIKVIRPGYNALNDTDPNHYIFHSDLNTFKIIKEGIATINYTGNGVYSFNHNAPISNASAFLTFVKFPDGSTTMGNGTFSAVSRNGLVEIKMGVNNTQIKCKIFSNGASGTLYIKYYIFETPLI